MAVAYYVTYIQNKCNTESSNWTSDGSYYLNNQVVSDFATGLFTSQNKFWVIEPNGVGKSCFDSNSVSVFSSSNWEAYYNISDIDVFIKNLCNSFETSKASCGWGFSIQTTNLVFFETTVASTGTKYFIPFFYQGDGIPGYSSVKIVSEGTLTTDLAHYWKMTSSNVDDVGLTCTDYNMSYSTSYGKIGGGAYFNGTSSYIHIGTGTIFSNPTGLNTRTISLWLYPTQSATTCQVIALHKEGEIVVQSVDGGANTVRINFTAKIGGTYQTWASNTVPINTWTHYAVTLDMNNRVCKTYVNGVYDRYSGGDTVQAGSLNAGTLPQRIGANIQGTPGDFYKGYLDEIGMWNRVLSPYEILELYNGGVGNQNPFTH